MVHSLLHFVGREAKAQRFREVACPTVEPGGSGVGLRKQTHCEKLAPFCKGAMMAKGGPLRTSRQWSEQDWEPKNCQEGLENVWCSENAGEHPNRRGVYNRIQGRLEEP